MRFSILGKIADVNVTTVVLEANQNIIQKDSPEGLLMWHCPIDNQPLFQYSGRQVMIVPGMVPTPLPILHECQKCRTKYLIISMI